jgi:transposase
VQCLKLQVEWLQKQLFGKKSERIDPQQEEMFAEGVEMGKPEPPLDSEKKSEPEEENTSEKPKRKRKTKDELGLRNLPVVHKETLIPEEVLANPEAYRKMGERYHDELDFQPGCLRYQRTVIPEYILIEDKLATPVRSAAPLTLIPNAMITPSLAASLIIDKHCDHLPHYRQSQRFFREQSVSISHKTINAWVMSSATLLAPIAECVGAELKRAELLQIDETPMHYLIPGSGKAHRGYLWVMREPKTGATYYHWDQRRNLEALLNLLGYDKQSKNLSFSGIIQCDGYTCYQSLSNAYKSIRLGSCMAHIRRKFLDDKSLILEPWIKYLLRAIKVLYRIERRLRNTNAPPDQVERTRRRYAKPIIGSIEQSLLEQRSQQRPSGSCGKAVAYALGQWDQLKLYLEKGELPIDNNGVENAIRPCKLGLKNYMFFGSFEAGLNNATLYTLIENCKAHGIHLREYLEYVLEAVNRLPAEELTPAKIAAQWATPAGEAA